MECTPHTAIRCIIDVWTVYEVWRSVMFQIIEVTDAMLRSLMYKCGWHGFGYIDTCRMRYGCRWHVVELMKDPDGNYSMSVVASHDEVRDAFDEVDFRTGYSEDCYPDGYTSYFELWHVNEHRYFLYDGAHSFCQYLDVLPKWFYCVEDWDGEKIYSFDAEDWEDTAKLYGGDSLSSPTIHAKMCHYLDRLDCSIERHAYFPVVTVKVL